MHDNSLRHKVLEELNVCLTYLETSQHRKLREQITEYEEIDIISFLQHTN